MIRLSAILLAALIAAAPLSQAAAQDRGGRGDRDRHGSQLEQQDERARISEAEAQCIAPLAGRAGRYRRVAGMRGDSYVVPLRDRDGRVVDIIVDVRSGRSMGER